MSYCTVSALSVLVLLVPVVFTFGCRRWDASPEEEEPAHDAAAVAEESEPERPPAERPTNRLANETSLYLLLHAHNPVDWYPWGEEAFAKARAEGKLIFLSIGYSSCYWCHVMERESFMDDEVAAMLNEHFVCIKVDREERPDVDEIYMTGLQVYYQLTGSPRGGGWPLTMFLTPDARPVIGGTYFPPRDRNGQTGLLSVLRLVQQAWQEKPEELRENAKVLAGLVKRQLQQQPAAKTASLNARLLDDVLAALADQFDPKYGGFGYSAVNPRHPKFPQPSNLVFLLDRADRSNEKGTGPICRNGPEGASHKLDLSPFRCQAESMLIATLEKMAAGGIRDHVGGGFHRYSTDRFWAIPHFEKMLYDNAQLASVYAEAYALTGHEDFRRITEEILDFVLREMTGPEGGFYSAIDAETDGEEGRYYVWQREELESVLSAEEFQLLAGVYGIDGGGNFEGGHVLLLPRPVREVARRHQSTEGDFRQRLAPILQKLLAVRDTRRRPTTDTKVLTAWTGLMIRGFADAGRVLDNRRYVEAAEDAARFVLQRLRTSEGRLLRTFGGGRAQLNAYLDDYAFLVDGLIALHRATGQRNWLEEADRLTATQIDLFWDEPRGGFFFTSEDHAALIARSKDPGDSALPSGNAVSAANLVYLAEELNRPEYLERAEKTLLAFTPVLQSTPATAPRMATSLSALLAAREASSQK